MRLTRILFFACGLLLAAGACSRAGAAIDLMWARHHGSASYYEEMDHHVAVVADAQGNVYTAGTARDTVTDTLCYVTTKYNQWGRVLWQSLDTYPQVYPYLDTPPATPYLVLDTSGNLYLGETENLWWGGQRWWMHAIRVIKFNGSTGSRIWNQTYRFGGPWFNLDDYLSGMVYDSVYHSLFLCCTKMHDHDTLPPGNSDYDWGIEKIDPDDGALLWDSAYSQSPGSPGATDFATGIAIGPGRDPVVCGACVNPNNNYYPYYNWVVARFNRTTGALVWANPWRRSNTREDNEEPWAICANDSGIYVAGFVYQNSSSYYGYALAKFRPDSTLRGSAFGFAFEEGYLRDVKHTTANGGRAYAVGTVYNDATSDYDWFTLACGTGLRPNDVLTESWQALLDYNENADFALAVQTDGLGRPWVMGSLDKDSVVDWTVRRYNPANGMPLGADLAYTRHPDDYDDLSVPTGFAFRDTNHIYLGGFTLNDSFDEEHTVVRFSAKIPSAKIDSLRTWSIDTILPLDTIFRDTTFAWRDTVDSGTVVRPCVFYHNNGYSLTEPKFRLYVSSLVTRSDTVHRDSTIDTVGTVPDSSRFVKFPDMTWRAVRRGAWAVMCSLDLSGDTSANNNRLLDTLFFVRVRDVGPDQIILADTFEEGGTITPQARVHNYGNTTALSFPVTFQIGDSFKTTTVTSLKPDSVLVVTFGSLTMNRGRYRARVYTGFATDLNRFNDTLNRPDSVFIRYRDVSCRGIIVPVGNYDENMVITPSAAFKNYGNVTSGFWTHFLINPMWDRGSTSPTPTITLPGLKPQSSLFATAQSGTTVKPAKQQSATGKTLAPAVQPRAPGSSNSSFVIRHPSFPLVDLPYHDSLYVTLAPGESLARTFPHTWTASPPGTHRADCYTLLANDRNRLNDTAHSTFSVGRHDVGVVAILAPRDTILAGNVTPRATVHNYGTSSETFKVFFRIAGGAPWIDSVTAIVGVGRDSTLNFRIWAATVGNYTGRCSTALATDADRSNDTLRVPFVVVRHDVGTVAILAPRDTVLAGNVAPRATVHNYGTVPETFKVYFRITGGTPWIDSVTAIVGVGRDSLLNFRNWPALVGNYSGKCSTALATDADRSNDTLRVPFVVVRHDVGTVAILAPRDTVLQGNVTPRATVHNYGSVAETFRAFFRIAGGAPWIDSVTAVVGVGRDSTLNFRNWAATVGNYTGRCSTALATDANRSNDTLRVPFVVVQHDVGAVAILAPRDTLVAGPVAPRATVHNYGSQSETFKVFFRIAGASSYSDSLALTLASGRDSTLSFPVWNAVPGGYTGRCSTWLATDANHSNDVTGNAFVVVRHDVGATAVNAPSGMVPPGVIQPRATVHNFGTVSETFKVFFRIAGTTSYADSVTLTLASGLDSLVRFANWNAVAGSYTGRCSTALATDVSRGNDTVSNAFTVAQSDVGVLAILAPRDSVPLELQQPQVQVRNYGSQVETFRVYFRMSGPTSYADSLTVNLAGGLDSTLSFAAWIPVAGDYTARCSTWLASDANRANDTLGVSFRAMVIILPGWTRRVDVPAGGKRKNVKDGGALAFSRVPGNDTDYVYAFKGNNTYEFYRYNIAAGAWATCESIPAYNSLRKKKAVKKGASLVDATDGRLYATKGNNTLDFWQYDPARPEGTRWTQMPDVPPGTKKCKEGVGSVAVYEGGTNYVYLLKGSGTFEFYRYNADANTWDAALPAAPGGMKGKPYKNGSCLTYDGGDTIYALKGSYNEFFAYSINSRTWTTRDTLPRVAPPDTRKKKVKDGAGMAFDNRIVYALKGGNTNEFWTYRCDEHRWYVSDPMPTFYRRVKGGGALTFGAERCWAFRGNNTLEFWQYKPALADGLPLAAGGSPKDVMGGFQTREFRFALSIAPNPLVSTAEIAYSLPGAGDVNVSLYDATGRLSSGLCSGRQSAGCYRLNLAGSHVPAGVYFLKLRFNDGAREQQLVTKVLVER